MNLVDMVESQVIASIKDEKDITNAINSRCNICFLLCGNLLNIKDYIDVLKKNDKYVFIHLDFLEGLSNSKITIEYITKYLDPHGIITTKPNMVKYAKEAGLLSIQRIFLIDNNALSNGIKLTKKVRPDAVEVLPGILPKVIDKLTKEIPQPIIVGGLISNKTEILEALKAGALAASVSNPELWQNDF